MQYGAQYAAQYSAQYAVQYAAQYSAQYAVQQYAVQYAVKLVRDSARRRVILQVSQLDSVSCMDVMTFWPF